MTVSVHATPPDQWLRENAAKVVDRQIGPRPGYDPELRRLASYCVSEFLAAYVLTTADTAEGDPWGYSCAVWAMGGRLGVPYDPPKLMKLYGLRAVADWRKPQLSSDEFEKWVKHVLRVLRPINAMAQLDRELFLQGRGITEEEINV